MKTGAVAMGVGALALAINACSSSPKRVSRKPSSEPLTAEVPRDLGEGVRQFREYVASDAFNAGTCGPTLTRLYNEIFVIPADHFDQAKLAKEGYQVLSALWESRLELRKKFAGFVRQGGVSEACEQSVRRALVVTRFIEEYLAEWKTAPHPNPGSKMPAWSGEFPYVVKAPGLTQVDFRSGDLLMSREEAFTAAAIARVGDVDGQFSHIAVVYIDEQTGRKYTIESHIEVGVIILPLESYFTDGKLRSVLFRHPNANLAHRAAKTVYDRAKTAIDNGANIPYDFAFDLKDPSEVFCAEIATIGYREVSGGKIELPMFQSKMNAKNRDFLDDIGMSGRSTFAPMDMEVEPRFEMIAEWRDLGRIHESHMKDAVLTKMFDWMERYDYVLRKTPTMNLKSGVLWMVRRWPVFSSLLQERFPKNMARKTIATTFALSDTGEALFKELVEHDADFRRRYGLWMTPKQMQDALEQVRIDDFSRWERWSAWQRRNEFLSPTEREAEPERSRFHELFRSRYDN